jgi:CBS domain-containing protein
VLGPKVLKRQPIVQSSSRPAGSLPRDIRRPVNNEEPLLSVCVGGVDMTHRGDRTLAAAGYEGHHGLLAGPRHHAERGKAVGVTASDIMSRPPGTIGAFDLVSHAAHIMYDRKVSCLPVVDGGRLIGMITRADVLGVFGRSDADIRWQVLDKVILRAFLVDPTAFSVTVQHGVVTLAGKPETAEVGRSIVTAVRHIKGVVAVRDELSYPVAK